MVWMEGSGQGGVSQSCKKMGHVLKHGRGRGTGRDGVVQQSGRVAVGGMITDGGIRFSVGATGGAPAPNMRGQRTPVSCRGRSQKSSF